MKAGQILKLLLSLPPLLAWNQVSATDNSSPMPPNLTIWGHVIASDEWQQYYEEYGVYSFDPATLERTPLINTWDCWFSTLEANGGSVYYDDVVHFINYRPMWYGPEIYYNEINTLNWDHQGMEDRNPQPNWSLIAMASAYDPSSGNVYAFTTDENVEKNQISLIDYATMESTKVASTDSTFIALACSDKGVLYGISEKGSLSIIDTATGSTTFIGYTGIIPAKVIQSATYVPSLDRIYWASMEGKEGSYKSALYEVNINTGVASKVKDFPHNEELAMLAVFPEPSPLRPGAPTELEANFIGGSNIGTVSFLVLSYSFDGTPMENDVEYKVKANSHVVAKGVAIPGKKTSLADIELPTGSVTIRVTLENNYGESDAAVIEKWIGFEMEPGPVQNLKVQIDDNKACLSWDPVTSGANGGYVDESLVRYYVTRYPGNRTICDDLKETSLIDALSPDTLKVYEYTVIARIDYCYSVPAFVRFKHGPAFNVPYTETFDNDGLFDEFDGFDTYTVVDANNDNCTFSCNNSFFGNGYVTYKPNKTNDADDWLISPPIVLKPERVYGFRMRAQSGRNEYPDRLEVRLGADTIPEHFAITIMEPKYLDGFYGLDEHYRFTVDTEGEYHFGIHDITPAGLLHGCEIDKVMIVEEALFDAPDTVANLKATAAPKGLTQTILTFDAPMTTVNGLPLKSIEQVQIMREDNIITTINNPKPGETIQYTDDSAIEGDNIYSVRAFNEYGGGLISDCIVVAGHDMPLPPVNGKIADNLNGTGTITWEPSPEIGEFGGYVDPEDLSYNVIRRDVYVDDYATLIIDDVMLEEGIKECSAIVQLPEAGKGQYRIFRNFFIEAVSSRKPDLVSRNADVGYILLGENYKLPFHDGFDDLSEDAPIWIYNDDDPWYLSSGLSSDGDGICLKFDSQVAGDEAHFSSWKIDINEAANPMLIFRYYALPGADMRLDVHVSRNNVFDGENDVVWETEYSKLSGYEGWTPVAIDLKPFKGEGYISFDFHATVNNTDWPIIIDDVNVRDVKEHDMRGVMCVVPDNWTAGETKEVTAVFENYGSAEACDYTVMLYVNGEIAETLEINTPLAPNFYDNGTFSVPTNVNDESLDIYAEIVYDSDQEPENNATDHYYIELLKPGYGFAAMSEQDAPDATGQAGGISIRNANGMNVRIYTPDGILVHEEKDVADTIIPMGSGLYIVTFNNTEIVKKVIVK